MYQLNINQEFNASASKLFNAWTNPELIAKWFAPGAMTVPEATSVLKVGGQYRVVMQNPDGEQFIVGGKYIEIDEPNKLVFSWKWEHGQITTKVEVLISELESNKSKLELIHTEFVDQEDCTKHHEGWLGCLANLPKAF